MSVFYNFTEVLEAHNVQEDSYAEEIIELMKSQLSMLSVVMVHKLVDVYDMKLVVDGKESKFNGDFYTTEIVDAIRSMDNANEISLFIDYSYWHYACNGDLNIGPFVMMDYLDEIDESAFKNISYAAYNRADCDPDFEGGVLCSYYFDGNKVHRGRVDSKNISDVPDGEWESPYTPWTVDDAKLSEDDINFLKNLAERMRPFAFVDDNINAEFDLDESGRCKYVSMEYAVISSKQDFETFLGLVGELVRWRNNRPEDEKEWIDITSSFVDISEHAPRILHAVFDEEGNYKLDLKDCGFKVNI